MATKITVIFDQPANAEAFEAAYATGVADLAWWLPGIQRLETSKVHPTRDGWEPTYRMIDMYFADFDTATAAALSPRADALFQNIASPATGRVQVLFAEVEVSD
jgi:uncharacterized protein (TIGR02118 family)